MITGRGEVPPGMQAADGPPSRGPPRTVQMTHQHCTRSRVPQWARRTSERLLIEECLLAESATTLESVQNGGSRVSRVTLWGHAGGRWHGDKGK